MLDIFVVSPKGKLLKVIRRNIGNPEIFRKRYGHYQRVLYKKKGYKLIDRRHTNLNGYAIYPYGQTRK